MNEWIFKMIFRYFLLFTAVLADSSYGGCGFSKSSVRSSGGVELISAARIQVTYTPTNFVSFDSVVKANLNQLRSCIERYIDRLPSFKKISAAIEPKLNTVTGRVQSVTSSLSFHDEQLKDCFERKLKRWTFPTGTKDQKLAIAFTNLSTKKSAPKRPASKRPVDKKRLRTSSRKADQTTLKGIIKQPFKGSRFGAGCGKPVIYLYPPSKQNIQVNLHLVDMKLHTTYPAIDLGHNGWDVTVDPSGHLVDRRDGQEYDYLFWDAIQVRPIEYSKKKGFVIEGSRTASFFQKILREMGMIPKEYNEFIVYWLPKMIQNKYNFITFLGSEYTERAKITTYPPYESSLRVYMVFEPLDKPIEVEPQVFEPFERKGFTLVEWGGQVEEF